MYTFTFTYTYMHICIYTYTTRNFPSNHEEGSNCSECDTFICFRPEGSATPKAKGVIESEDSDVFGHWKCSEQQKLKFWWVDSCVGQICKGTGRSVWQPSGLPIKELFIIVISTPFWVVLHQVISAKNTWSFLKWGEPPTSHSLFQGLYDVARQNFFDFDFPNWAMKKTLAIYCI